MKITFALKLFSNFVNGLSIFNFFKVNLVTINLYGPSNATEIKNGTIYVHNCMKPWKCIYISNSRSNYLSCSWMISMVNSGKTFTYCSLKFGFTAKANNKAHAPLLFHAQKVLFIAYSFLNIMNVMNVIKYSCNEYH